MKEKLINDLRNAACELKSLSIKMHGAKSTEGRDACQRAIYQIEIQAENTVKKIDLKTLEKEIYHHFFHSPKIKARRQGKSLFSRRRMDSVREYGQAYASHYNDVSIKLSKRAVEIENEMAGIIITKFRVFYSAEGYPRAVTTVEAKTEEKAIEIARKFPKNFVLNKVERIK
ncbi:hypothetical protein AB4565_18280 [Vibrio breoganii]